MIRRPLPQDHQIIRELLNQAFAPSTAESSLFDGVKKGTEDHFDWVAEEDSLVAGYILYTRAWKDSEPVGFHLAPLAVLPQFQGQGIGSNLIRQTLNQPPLRERAVFVLGDPGYYEQFGFAPTQQVRCPYDETNQHFRARSWTESEESFIIGYSNAFNEVFPR